MGWIDSHCHINFEQFDTSVLVPQLIEQNCEGVLVPATELTLFPDVIALHKQYPNIVYIALGLHPYFLSSHKNKHLEQLDEQIRQFRPDAVGEFGLDFMLQDIQQEQQYFYFREQLLIAKQHKLPLVIHCRKAHDQIASEVKKNGFTQGGFIHGFSGSEQQAKRYLDLGFKLGLGGALTYKRAKAMHKMVAKLPDDGFTLETDSPDMSPSFANGEVNTPLNIPKIGQFVADIRGQSLEHVLNISRQNFYSILK